MYSSYSVTVTTTETEMLLFAKVAERNCPVCKLILLCFDLQTAMKILINQNKVFIYSHLWSLSRQNLRWISVDCAGKTQRVCLCHYLAIAVQWEGSISGIEQCLMQTQKTFILLITTHRDYLYKSEILFVAFSSPVEQSLNQRDTGPDVCHPSPASSSNTSGNLLAVF